MYQKEFTIENDIQKKDKDLENAKEIVAEFKRRISMEVRQQERIERKKNLEKLKRCRR